MAIDIFKSAQTVVRMAIYSSFVAKSLDGTDYTTRWTS